MWWWCAILLGIVLVLIVFFFEESKFRWSKAPQITSTTKDEKQRLAAHETPATGTADPSSDTEAQPDGPSPGGYVTKLQVDPSIPRRTYWRSLVYTTTTPGHWSQFLRHTYQPFHILFTIPGVAYMSLVYGVLQAWYCVMVSALATYMIGPPYEFSPTAVGLMNLSPFVGNTLGSLVCGPLSDRLVLYLAKRRGGVYEPEMRLWLFVFFIPFQVAGAFWFGHALNGGQSWSAVAVAWGMCTFGTAPLSSTALTYMTDAYNEVRRLLLTPPPV